VALFYAPEGRVPCLRASDSHTPRANCCDACGPPAPVVRDPCCAELVRSVRHYAVSPRTQVPPRARQRVTTVSEDGEQLDKAETSSMQCHPTALPTVAAFATPFSRASCAAHSTSIPLTDAQNLFDSEQLKSATFLLEQNGRQVRLSLQHTWSFCHA
jgi:hypothetical protein